MKRAERGFTLVEIMIVVAIIALLAAIAIPNVLRGRASANEAAAVGNVHALVSSLEMYRSANNQYPGDTAWLGEMVTNAEPDFAPAAFAQGTGLNLSGANANLQGYTYDYSQAANSPQTYTLSAVPTSTSTGSRAFFADESGVVRHCKCATSGSCTVPTVNENTLDAPPNDC